MSRKAVFFDIDGTLYDLEVGIPDSAKEAIAKLKENGHAAVICTGRARAFIEDEILRMKFDSIIAGAGTYVENEGERIENVLLNQDTLKIIYDILTEFDIPYFVEGPDYLYYNEKETDEEYMKRFHAISRDIQTAPFVYDQSQANKFSCFLNDETREVVIEKFADLFDIIIHDNMPFAEMLPKGYSKASGIRKLLRVLDIDIENTYAFGDSNNDLEMLEYVNYGIAMGNANDTVLSRAKYRTKALREDGIYWGLKEFGLIG